MTIFVFTGPTLAPSEARQILDAIYLPPVAQGDVYRATLHKPVAIGIIDGYFESVPSVWHKEILWAMREGIHVFGAASMGALRAAELAQFGMEGVGQIFDWFHSSALEDDDEVAVAHSSRDDGFTTLSTAMVDIRATLAKASAAGIISTDTAAALVSAAKHIFYPQRLYPTILQAAATSGLPAAELDQLRAWLPDNKINQKRDDAVQLLTVLRDRFAGGTPEPKRVNYTFQYTNLWDSVVSTAGEMRLTAADSPDSANEHVPLDVLLDELRLSGSETYAQALQAAMFRLATLAQSKRQKIPLDPSIIKRMAQVFRRARGLGTQDRIMQWLAANNLTPDQFQELLTDEARLQWMYQSLAKEAEEMLPDTLRVTGEYSRLMARAEIKLRFLEQHGLQYPSAADVGLSEDALLRWHFDRYGEALPSDLDDYAYVCGFQDLSAFKQAVVREYCFVTRYVEPEAART